DPPADHKDYLHRGGRTARAGRAGTVVTLVLPEQRREMDDLMSKAGITPHTSRVRPGDPELARITGARAPSRAAAPAPAAQTAKPRPGSHEGAKAGKPRPPRDRGPRRRQSSLNT